MELFSSFRQENSEPDYFTISIQVDHREQSYEERSTTSVTIHNSESYKKTMDKYMLDQSRDYSRAYGVDVGISTTATNSAKLSPNVSLSEAYRVAMSQANELQNSEKEYDEKRSSQTTRLQPGKNQVWRKVTVTANINGELKSNTIDEFVRVVAKQSSVIALIRQIKWLPGKPREFDTRENINKASGGYILSHFPDIAKLLDGDTVDRLKSGQQCKVRLSFPMQQKSVAIAKSLDTAPALHSKILEIYAEKLKEYGINPKRYVPRCGISHGMVTINTPRLLKAAKKNDKDSVIKLLNEGVDVDKEGDDGSTALSIAAFYGHIEIVKILVYAGANVNARKRAGSDNTPLQQAVSGDEPEVVEFLLGHGAAQSLNWQTYEDRNVTECARRKGKTECLKILEEWPTV